MEMEPIEHGNAAGRFGVGRMAAVLEDGIEGAGDGDFVLESERSERQERAGHVKRRWEKASVHFAATSLWIEKEETVEEFYFAVGAYAAVKVFKVGAAAKGDVLAIVDELAIRQDVGSRTSTEERALLKETYAPTGFS